MLQSGSRIVWNEKLTKLNNFWILHSIIQLVSMILGLIRFILQYKIHVNCFHIFDKFLSSAIINLVKASICCILECKEYFFPPMTWSILVPWLTKHACFSRPCLGNPGINVHWLPPSVVFKIGTYKWEITNFEKCDFEVKILLDFGWYQKLWTKFLKHIRLQICLQWRIQCNLEQ